MHAFLMLEARVLSKDYGSVRAVDGLSFTVAEGTILALLGANGAGKSTTTQMLLGLVEPSSGAAYVDGIDVRSQPLEARRCLAYIPDRLELYPHLTARENLEYFQRLRRMDRSPTWIESCLAKVGFPSTHVDAKVSTFSKGTRQKVGLALALAKSAKALLLDEPLSGLDPSAANECCARLRRVRDDGAAVLMATHDLFRARDTADWVGIMCRGRLLHRVRASEITHAELEALYLEAVR